MKYLPLGSGLIIYIHSTRNVREKCVHTTMEELRNSVMLNSLEKTESWRKTMSRHRRGKLIDSHEPEMQKGLIVSSKHSTLGAINRSIIRNPKNYEFIRASLIIIALNSIFFVRSILLGLIPSPSDLLSYWPLFSRSDVQIQNRLMGDVPYSSNLGFTSIVLVFIIYRSPCGTHILALVCLTLQICNRYYFFHPPGQYIFLE